MIPSKSHKSKVRKEVLLMRKSISTVVTLLAHKKIPVTLSGKSAYVQSDKMGNPVAVNLPSIPDDASDQILSAMRGFLDHEVAHILFTDFIFLSENIPAQMMHIWNICEDIYIERKMTDSLRGCGFNLNKTRKYVIECVFNDAYLTIDSNDDQNKIFIEVMGVPVMRALCGQTEFLDWLDDDNKWQCVQTTIAAINAAGIPKMINKSTCTKDVYEAAKILAKLLTTDLSKADQESITNKDNSESLSDDTDNEAKMKAAPSSENDDGTKDDGTDDDDTKDDTANSEGINNSDTQDDTSEADNSDDQKNGQSTLEVSNEEAKSFTFDDSLEPMSFESCLEEIINSGHTDRHYSPMNTDLDWIGNIVDYGEAVRNISLQTGILPAYANAAVIDINDFYLQSSQYFNKQIKPLLLTGAAMSKQIERLILGREKSHWQGSRKTGVVHGGSLFKLQLGDNRVFRNKQLTKAKNACILIVNDLSGSMTNKTNGISRINQALASSYTIADAMDKCKIPCMVAGFTTIGEDSEAAMLARTKARGEITDKIVDTIASACKSATRYEPLAIPIIKDWSTPCTQPSVNKNFGFCAGYTPLLRNNVDGESLLALLPLISTRTEEVKIMLVLSDGVPAAMGSGMNKHLLDVTHYIDTQTDITLIGVGISTDTDYFYSNACRVDDLLELPDVVCRIIKKALLN